MKKTELPCAVVEDLLPAYLEGLTSAETNAAVEDHLASCPACAAKRAAMGGGDDAAQAEQAETAREVDYLKAVRRRGRRRVWLAVVCTALVLAMCAAVKLFIIGSPASEGSVAVTSAHQEGYTLHLQFSSLSSGMDFRDWTITDQDGYISVTARQVLSSPISPKSREITVPVPPGTQEVRVCGRLVWQDGKIYTTAEGGIVDVWEARTPYVGDASALGKLADALNLYEFAGSFTSSLQTSTEPYRWTLELESASGGSIFDEGYGSFDAPLMLALVENLGEVAWTYTDDAGVTHTHVVSLQAANAMLEDATEQYNELYGTDWTAKSSVKEYTDTAADLRQLYNISWLHHRTAIWTSEGCCNS